MYILKIFSTFFSLISLVNIYSQDTIRVTRIITEFDYDYSTEKETENTNDRDTSIYNFIKFENGSFKNELISSTNNSIPFFYNQRTIIDSNKYHLKHFIEYTNYRKNIFESFYNKNETLTIIKDVDSNILAIQSYKSSKLNPKKIKKATIFDYRNKITSISNFQSKSFVFGLIEIKKWREFSNKTLNFNLDLKAYKIFNKQIYLRPEKKWKERSIIKYKKGEIIWEKSRDYDHNKKTYKYDFLERRKTKVVNNKFFGFNFDVKQYKYDKLGRLIEEIHSDFNRSSNYKYIYIYD